MPTTRSRRGQALAVLLCTASLPAQGLTPIQVMRLAAVSSVLDAGEQGILFTRTVPRSPREGSGNSHVKLFRRSPSGEETLFLTAGSGFALWEDKVTYVGRTEGLPHPEVLAKSLVDGAVTRVTLTPRGVQRYQWSPDFQSIAFTQIDAPSPARSKRETIGFRPRVFDEDFRDIRLFVWSRQTGAVRQLTRRGSVFDFFWSPDSRRLALALAPRNLVDDSYMFKRIHTIDLQGNLTRVGDNPGKLGDMAWSPDGTQIAYISAADKRDPHAGMVYLLDVEKGTTRPLTPGFRGMVHHITWPSGTRLHALVSKGVQTQVAAIDTATAKMTVELDGGALAITATAWSKDRPLFVASSAMHPGELFLHSSTGHQRLTNSNPWLDAVQLGRQEVARFKARDGLEIEGILMFPIDYKPETRYPMVIVAHGGPESHFSVGWNTGYSRWGQMLSARGYFAWYPNYRSSTGYGVEFTKHDHGDLMGGEFQDHLDAIEHFDSLGYIDPKRVGIGGGSYGGYTAAWAATRETRHFAAAVSFVPFVDVRTKWYTSDIPWEFYYVHYQERHAHEQAGYLADRSPLTFAADCRTPLLLLGGTADPRVHPSQPHMLYRAVKFATETPVRYVQYPGEGHGNRNNLNRYDYALRTLRWFDHYLKPGDHRTDPPPGYEVDYEEWYRRM